MATTEKIAGQSIDVLGTYKLSECCSRKNVYSPKNIKAKLFGFLSTYFTRKGKKLWKKTFMFTKKQIQSSIWNCHWLLFTSAGTTRGQGIIRVGRF